MKEMFISYFFLSPLPCSTKYTSVHYNGVENAGIENNIGYMTTDIEMMTLSYNFYELMPVPLCYYYLKASDANEYDCPGDGSYGFTTHYVLPSAGGESTSWLATGWAGTGTISLYAENDDTMLIGQCTFDLRTFVTPNEERGIFQTPSAAASVGMVAGTVAVGFIICVWMYCCHQSSQDDDGVGGKICSDDLTHLSSDEITTLFKKLDEETRSQLSKDSQRMFSGIPSCGPCGASTSVPDGADESPPTKTVEKPPSSKSNKTSISSMAL